LYSSAPPDKTAYRESSMMKSDAYRAEHESFVSNGKGTSVGCIMAYMAHVPAFIVLLKLSQGFRKPRIVRDVAVLVVPTLLSMTVLAEYNYWSLACIIVLLTIAVNTSQRDSHTDTDVASEVGYQNTSYLTLFKGGTHCRPPANVSPLC
jgi:hypothetical protein